MKAAELTELAITWLQDQHPDAYVTTELSVAEWGGASVDVAAITQTEIVGVEIKGDGDSPTRLELQGLKYGRVCRSMWLLVTPDGTLGDRCAKRKPPGWGRLHVEAGKIANWHPRARPQPHLCAMAMCETLWRDELAEIARLEPGVFVRGSRPRVPELREGIVASLPTPRIHELMIGALRKRIWPVGKTVYAPRDMGRCPHCAGTGKWQGANLADLARDDIPCGYCRGLGRTDAK